MQANKSFWHCTKLDAGNLALVVYLNGIFADTFSSIHFQGRVILFVYLGFSIHFKWLHENSILRNLSKEWRSKMNLACYGYQNARHIFVLYSPKEHLDFGVMCQVCWLMFGSWLFIFDSLKILLTTTCSSTFQHKCRFVYSILLSNW